MVDRNNVIVPANDNRRIFYTWEKQKSIRNRFLFDIVQRLINYYSTRHALVYTCKSLCVPPIAVRRMRGMRGSRINIYPKAVLIKCIMKCNQLWSKPCTRTHTKGLFLFLSFFLWNYSATTTTAAANQHVARRRRFSIYLTRQTLDSSQQQATLIG